MEQFRAHYQKGDLVVCLVNTDPFISNSFSSKLFLQIPKKKMVFRIESLYVILGELYFQFEFSSLYYPQNMFVLLESLTQKEQNEYLLFQIIPN
jgi:hypothetical protein